MKLKEISFNEEELMLLKRAIVYILTTVDDLDDSTEQQLRVLSDKFLYD